MRILPILANLVLFGSMAIGQTTWLVDARATPPGNGSVAQPYVDLQFALAQVSTVSGDTLLVEPGTYIGAFDFLGKNVTVRSTQGAAVTTYETIYAQWFARDALNPDGTGWSLSNAIEFTVCP